MIKKIILGIIFYIFLYIFITRLYPYYHNKYVGCSLHKDVYIQSIKSTIRRKFIDSDEHAYPTISYIDSDGFEKSMILFGEFDGMFDFISVGDSIVKEKNSLFYKIKSTATGKDSIFEFDTACQDSIKRTEKR